MPVDLLFAAVGIPAMTVLAVASPTDLPIVQYGALGILAFIVFWTLVKIFPKMIASQSADRVAFLKELKEERSQQWAVREEFIEQLKQQRHHDGNINNVLSLQIEEIRQKLNDRGKD